MSIVSMGCALSDSRTCLMMVGGIDPSSMPNHCRWDPSDCLGASHPLWLESDHLTSRWADDDADSRIAASTRGLAIDADCEDGCSDGSDVWTDSSAISCHHGTTPLVLLLLGVVVGQVAQIR